MAMNQTSKTTIYLIAGALIGMGVAYLLFREKEQGVNDQNESGEPDALQEKLEAIRKKIDDKIQESSVYVEQFIDELVKDGTIETSELIGLLEGKLKSLKAK